MELPSDGQEYAHITFDQLPTGAQIEASTDNRATWTPTEPGTDPLERVLLLRGPASPRTQGHLVADNCTLWIRLLDTPEDVIRDAGPIYIT